jgi:anti-anti-sigma factor
LTELPAEFQITTEQQDGARVVRVAGEVDISTHESLGEHLARAVRAAGAGQPVVVDLSSCDFIDSSGIRALLLGFRTAEENSDARPPFAIAGPTPQVARVLELTGVDDAIGIYGSVDEALKSL